MGPQIWIGLYLLSFLCVFNTLNIKCLSLQINTFYYNHMFNLAHSHSSFILSQKPVIRQKVVFILHIFNVWYLELEPIDNSISLINFHQIHYVWILSHLYIFTWAGTEILPKNKKKMFIFWSVHSTAHSWPHLIWGANSD